jgi:hypothetical protein
MYRGRCLWTTVIAFWGVCVSMAIGQPPGLLDAPRPAGNRAAYFQPQYGMLPDPEPIYAGDGQFGAYAGDCHADHGDCCPSFCHCCQPVGFYAGVELAILKAYVGTPVTTELVQLGARFDHEVSPRVWIGYQNACGFGVRARYWQFDHSVSIEEFNSTPSEYEWIGNRLELHVVDAEVTQTFCLGGWNGLAAGGVRHASVEAELFGGGYLNLHAARFDGTGPTIAVTLRRPFNDCCTVGFVADARGSLLFGNTRDEVELINSMYERGLQRLTDHHLTVLEIGIGLEFCREFDYGLAVVRVMMEGQSWDFGATRLVSVFDINDIGFFGPTVGIQLSR